jgi:hypothetical protein|tara:strand:+ start:6193 stop:6471 length:279 start_codon:yes stop_codon:yes gene_type:complete
VQEFLSGWLVDFTYLKINKRYLPFQVKKTFMSLNKNKIFGYTALVIMVLGSALLIRGITMYSEYPDYAIVSCVAGVGFFAIAWAFNALKGRI